MLLIFSCLQFGSTYFPPVLVTTIVVFPAARIFSAVDKWTKDQAGYSVSGGFDVNGDGVSDFVIGAPEGGTIGEFDGEAYVIFGQVCGRSHKMCHTGNSVLALNA